MEGISALRDESDKDGMRIVIEVKRDAVGEVVLNNLYSQTQLQVSFGINMVALHHGQPKIMNLKDIIAAFVRHRREVVTRRTIFELRKARDRAHILESAGRCAGQHRPDYRTDPSRADPGRSENGAGCPGVGSW
ncbi:DNA gyrase subunit A [Klebsiella pneumoniae subsp. ozaenae]|uniref:DNA gyrase subunit A n=1 Tax=Klebsiella pneumoniae subsp. ozaenae TaxID=574 RepID=A0A378A3G5_KLEPO|nr:DNA gyrase subunit A [Klebsiella pneumoniae subsp. ozaenae]